jgi:hypothetical protein
MSSPPPKVLLFDIGGVCVSYLSPYPSPHRPPILITPSTGRIPLRSHPRLRAKKLHPHRLDQHCNLSLGQNRRMGKTRTRTSPPRLLFLHRIHPRPPQRKAMEKFLHQAFANHQKRVNSTSSRGSCVSSPTTTEYRWRKTVLEYDDYITKAGSVDVACVAEVKETCGSKRVYSCCFEQYLYFP